MKKEKFCGASGGIGSAGSPGGVDGIGGGATCWASTIPAVKIREKTKLKTFLRVMENPPERFYGLHARD
jgi:hypothetical protein